MLSYMSLFFILLQCFLVLDSASCRCGCGITLPRACCAGFVLHFRLGPSLFGRIVSVYSNHPASPDEEFCRDKYRLLPWQSDSKIIDDTSIFVEIPIVRAGSFRYYFTHTEG